MPAIKSGYSCAFFGLTATLTTGATLNFKFFIQLA